MKEVSAPAQAVSTCAVLPPALAFAALVHGSQRGAEELVVFVHERFRTLKKPCTELCHVRWRSDQPSGSVARAAPRVWPPCLAAPRAVVVRGGAAQCRRAHAQRIQNFLVERGLGLDMRMAKLACGRAHVLFRLCWDRHVPG